MTSSILSLTLNNLTSLNRAKPEINASKSETAPTKPPRGTLDLHHSKYNDTKLTRKSVTYVVELKCYPCEWRACRVPPPTWGDKFTRMQSVYSKVDSM